MRRDKSGIIVIVFIIIAVAAVIATVLIRNNLNKKDGNPLDVSSFTTKGITEAYRIDDKDGNASAYEVYVTTEGYKGPISTKISIDSKKERLVKVEVLSQTETEELGGKIQESSFLNQFVNVPFPVTLKGKATTEGKSGETGTGSPDDSVSGSLGEGVKRKDGSYHAAGTRAANGYLSEVWLTIEDGEIKEVIWESTDEAGNTKRIQSLNDEYKMTEDGKLWADQADAIERYVVEHQGLAGLSTDEEGKTDAVSGVSISVDEFKELVDLCLLDATGQASGGEGNGQSSQGGTGDGANQGGSGTGENQDGSGNGDSQGGQSGTGSGDSQSGENGENGGQNTTAGTEVDAVSGATISSTAVITAINTAYEFVLTQK